MEGPDATPYTEAVDATELAEALAIGERIADDLLGTLDVDPRPRDVRPYRVQLCDETLDDSPRIVSVGRGIAFPSDATDELTAQARDLLEGAGVDGVRVLREDSILPMVTGVFAGDTWQVAVSFNRPDGIGEIRVNSACLPGDVPDPPESS
ncbi:hypothetical protein [Nitriliruptor alkaliphilus]|uniref:hypothetical protein n=1 Tax=Nitriliruptor alkaliphilus TaxID=427918 RepID=UPI000696C321|nr:hypothetical protein [Nitriliruptor alkaliphilus]